MGSMKGPIEQRGLFSRLPDDPEYWHKLTDRIAVDAGADLQRFGESRREWWSEIARYSTLLALGASAAVLASFLLMPTGGAAEIPERTVDAYGLAPDDPLAVTLVSGETPPALGSLMAARTAEFER
jgi:hypothetical protein